MMTTVESLKKLAAKVKGDSVLPADIPGDTIPDVLHYIADNYVPGSSGGNDDPPTPTASTNLYDPTQKQEGYCKNGKNAVANEGYFITGEITLDRSKGENLMFGYSASGETGSAMIAQTIRWACFKCVDSEGNETYPYENNAKTCAIPETAVSVVCTIAIAAKDRALFIGYGTDATTATYEPCD